MSYTAVLVVVVVVVVVFKFAGDSVTSKTFVVPEVSILFGSSLLFKVAVAGRDLMVVVI